MMKPPSVSHPRVSTKVCYSQFVHRLRRHTKPKILLCSAFSGFTLRSSHSEASKDPICTKLFQIQIAPWCLLNPEKALKQTLWQSELTHVQSETDEQHIN